VHRVLILGIPRSGTTWIAQTLRRARGAIYVHEPDGVTEPFAMRAQRRDGLTHFPVLHPGDKAPEFARLWDGAFSGGLVAGTRRDEFARRAFRHVPDRRKGEARGRGHWSFELRVAIGAAVPRIADPDADAIVVKSVNAPFAAEWVAQGWKPSVLVVHRDLRNVMASWLDLKFGGTPLEIYRTATREAMRRWDVSLPEYDDPLTRSIGFCAVATAALQDDLRANAGWVGISHEQACIDSARHLSATAAALGLTWTDEAEEFVRDSDRPGSGYETNRVASEAPDAWSRRLNARQVETIESVLAQLPPELVHVEGAP
jgi:hypothetical protein